MDIGRNDVAVIIVRGRYDDVTWSSITLKNKFNYKKIFAHTKHFNKSDKADKRTKLSVRNHLALEIVYFKHLISSSDVSKHQNNVFEALGLVKNLLKQ